MSHPWELTLAQFIERVHRDYGIDLRSSSSGSALIGPHGTVRFTYLESPDKSRVVLPEMEQDDLLPLELLESFLRQLGIPRESFYLDPDAE